MLKSALNYKKSVDWILNNLLEGFLSSGFQKCTFVSTCQGAQCMHWLHIASKINDFPDSRKFLPLPIYDWWIFLATQWDCSSCFMLWQVSDWCKPHKIQGQTIAVITSLVQIYFVILTNIFLNLEKYILCFDQIYFRQWRPSLSNRQQSWI